MSFLNNESRSRCFARASERQNYWSDPVALQLYGGPSGFSTEISPGGAPLTLESWLRTAGDGQVRACV